ncbi:MAG: hypothetical protein H0X24_12080 [Ktedonobacterales bacterium]|nr:hypothetical protein [Ktedonobacterales bacterium]
MSSIAQSPVAENTPQFQLAHAAEEGLAEFARNNISPAMPFADVALIVHGYGIQFIVNTQSNLRELVVFVDMHTKANRLMTYTIDGGETQFNYEGASAATVDVEAIVRAIHHAARVRITVPA